MCLNPAAHLQVSLWPWLGDRGRGPGDEEDPKLPVPRLGVLQPNVPTGGGEQGGLPAQPPALLPPADPTDSGNFGFKNMLDARVEGEVDVPKTVKVTGTAGLSQNSTLEVQTLSVAPKALETLHQER